MGFTVPTTEPAELRAGDTWRWTRELSEYPASVWTLTYHLRNAAAFFDVVATADGDLHDITVAMATTANYSPGRYTWTALVSDGVSRHEIGTGILEVLADVSLPAAHDGRVWARQMLDAVEAALLGKATKSQLDTISVELGDRGITYDRKGLLVLRSQLRIEAAREEGSPGSKHSRILVRFR